jgi:hypothetical protein
MFKINLELAKMAPLGKKAIFFKNIARFIWFEP